jgi:hypothetical protein
MARCFLMRRRTALGILGTLLVGLLTWAAGGPAAWAQTLRPVDQATVVDAKGKKVGALLGEATMFLEVGDGSLVLVGVLRHGWYTWYQVGFVSSDCSGTPYDTGDYEGVVGSGVILPPGNTLYRRDPNATPAHVTLHSYYYQECFTIDGGSEVTAVPYVAVVDLDTVFTPPFHAISSGSSPTAQCCGDCNGNGTVTVDEILTSVNYALNSCPAQ